MEWNGDRILRELNERKARVIRDAAEALLEESKQTVPHDEGVLENSGHVSSDEDKANVYYDTPYAVRLHEHPEYNFQGKGEGKWLQKALNRMAPELIKYIKRGLRL
jgi:hypothetical protein